MNMPENLSFPEDIPGIERQTLIDMRDGLAHVRKLAEQKERGADVAPELEEAREKLLDRLAKALSDVEEEVRGKVQHGEQGNLL
jgi:hypothetical protein